VESGLAQRRGREIKVCVKYDAPSAMVHLWARLEQLVSSLASDRKVAVRTRIGQ
jgi:hypothetical protein